MKLHPLSLFACLAFLVLDVATAQQPAQPPRVRNPEGNQPPSQPGSPAANQPSALPEPNVPPPPKSREPGTQRYEGRQTRPEARAGDRNARIRPPGGGWPASRWYLGVFDERAPRGVRLARISPGSPAARFGLEPGDYLLDIGGYVVGDYNGVYYPPSLAMNFGTDPSGWAELLVWNKRTYAEETLWVQLQRR